MSSTHVLDIDGHTDATNLAGADMDVQQMAEGLEFGEPVPEFESIRTRVEGLLEQGEGEKVRLELESCREWGDDSRSALENCWLYRHLGQVYLAGEAKEKAVDAYLKAFEKEPRNAEVAMTLSELLMAGERFEEGLNVTKILLLNHKSELPDDQIALIYRRIGLLHEGNQEYAKARTAFEKALVKEPESPQALSGLLRAVGEVGEPGDVVDARLKLIRSLDDARSRSMALVALGNDWIEKFNDPGRAMDTYEEAVTEWKENTHAVERIAKVAAELKDWRRVGRAYYTLSVLTEDPQQKAEFLIRSSDVARKELWEPEKALAGYRKALEFDPTRLDAFKAVTSILVDARDWENLEQAYLQVIADNQESEHADPRLLGVLWEKLGDLYSVHLERSGDAVFAYGQGLEHAPDRFDIRERIVELTEEDEEHYDAAAEQLQILMKADPSEPQWVDRLGRVCLRQKSVDRAYCLFRALRAGGHDLDDKVSGFLERFDSKIAPTIKGQINPSMMQRYVHAEGLKKPLNTCFTILKGALDDWAGESRRKYGLRRRDRVDLSDTLAFVNFYRNVGAAFGYIELPALWHKSDAVGMVNGALVPPGFIVGNEKLSSGREKHIAFVVAKQLFLFMPPFYLATIRPLTDLQGFFVRAYAAVKDSDVASSFSKDSAFKVINKNIKGDEREALRKVVDQLADENQEVVLGPWVEAIEDTANRMGLLFCDDLSVARDCMNEETESISNRSVDKRMRALIGYSVSENYLSLRSQLGIEIA